VEARFSATVQTGPGAHPASYTTGTGSFPGVKRAGRGVDHPTPSSAEVKEEYSCTVIPLLPHLAFVACSRVDFTFTFYFYPPYLNNSKDKAVPVHPMKAHKGWRHTDPLFNFDTRLR